ncbi:MAG: MarR family transcriptional regulator [Bacteroidales bacterium]|nr:MarR family transcriptional regulator [Bacteroidales bacterium]
MKIQDTVDYQVRATLFAMRRMYNLLASEQGTTQGVAYVLIHVPKEGIEATRIAPMMGMGATSLSRLLKNMEDDELIYRRKDNQDKRKVFIHLTEKGSQLRKKVRQVVIDFNQKIFPHITDEEIKGFVKVCSMVRKQVCDEINRLGVDDCRDITAE